MSFYSNQLVHRHGGARRPFVAEEFAIDLVVAAEIVHVDEIRADLDAIGQIRPRALKDVADVLDHRAGLHLDVQPHRAHRVLLGTGLGGKTLGILGLGRIGAEIAKRAQAFGMKIRYHNRRQKDVSFAYDPDAVTLAENSDVLMVITPGGADTEKLVNAQVLDALGPQGYLINVARGSVIDEPVVLRYLQEKRIAGAGLDVFEHEPKVPPEFFALDNVVLTPHVASATHETRTAMGNLQIENLHLHFAGKPVKTPVV